MHNLLREEKQLVLQIKNKQQKQKYKLKRLKVLADDSFFMTLREKMWCKLSRLEHQIETHLFAIERSFMKFKMLVVFVGF